MEWNGNMTTLTSYVSASALTEGLGDWCRGHSRMQCIHKRLDAVYLNLLWLGKSEVTRGTHEVDGYTFVLVVLKGVRGYVCLPPAKVGTREFTAKQLVAWCASFGTPKVWISEDGKHFKNGLSGGLPLRFGFNID